MEKEVFDIALSAMVPSRKQALQNAATRGFLFPQPARGLAADCFKAEADLGADLVRTKKVDAYKLARAQLDSILYALCDAADALAATETEAAKLAKGALADFLNAWYAENPLEALRRAFDNADAAARAYFVEAGKWDGSTTRTQDTARAEREETAEILAALGIRKRGGKFQGVQSKATKDRFAHALAERHGGTFDAAFAEGCKRLARFAAWQNYTPKGWSLRG